MKLLIVLPLEPWFKGGVEKVVKEYSKCLQKDHEITILCTRTNFKKKIQKKQWMNIQVLIFKSYAGILRIAPDLVKYVKLNARNFDLLVIHNYSTMLPAQILWFKSNIQIPIVLTPHFHTQGSTVALRVFRVYYDLAFRKIFLKRIDAIQFVSRTEKSEFMRKFPVTMQHTVVYNGINIERFAKIVKEQKGEKEKIILCVGRLEKYKNIQFVMRTLENLPGEFILVVIGTGPFEKSLKELTLKLKLEKRVEFLGAVEDLEYNRWLSKSGIYIQPSTIESFGMTTLEAVASGIRSIVNTKAYGLREVQSLFSNDIIGLKMVKGTEKELAEIIKKNFNEKRSIDKIKVLDWKNQAKKLENFYKKVLIIS